MGEVLEEGSEYENMKHLAAFHLSNWQLLLLASYTWL